MQTSQGQSLKRYTLGALPLLDSIAQKLGLRDILCHYIRQHGNETIHPVDALLIIIYNIAIAKDPLYELHEWCNSFDLTRIGLPGAGVTYSDDRFGKALDKLYEADLASLMVELAIAAIRAFDIHTSQLHNDSTSVKAFGRIPGITKRGLQLKKGNSKDHRPDLKQLIYTLTISADGAIPLHHRCYPGNRTDDTTHIDTWDILREIVQKADFLYVGDSKLCTHEQLRYIAKHGGRAITIMPETWSEVSRFKDEQRYSPKRKRVIWRRTKPNSELEREYFSVFDVDHLTDEDAYRIHWIYSSEKRSRDRLVREEMLRKTETALSELNARINTRNLKTVDQIQAEIDTIVQRSGISRSLHHITIATHRQKIRRQIGKGRPSQHTKYETTTEVTYSLSWRRNRQQIIRESRLDGVFPMLCTDSRLSAKQVLKAYKYQPNIEKRFQQFKKIHLAAPLLFKKIERVEANMFAFFISLLLQALLEREIRRNMKAQDIEKLYIYPEDRECKSPSTTVVFDRFASVSRYELYDEKSKVAMNCFRDNFTESQMEILSTLKMTEDQFWHRL